MPYIDDVTVEVTDVVADEEMLVETVVVAVDVSGCVLTLLVAVVVCVEKPQSV